MAEKTVRVSAEALTDFCTRALAFAGMPEKDALLCAKSLVLTNLWGVDSHGVLRLPIYMDRIRCRAINPFPDIKTICEFAALRMLDGDAGHGFVTCHEAMAQSVALAGQYGLGCVGLVNSNHSGASALYARQAAEAGMISIVFTNTMPNMVSPGAAKPIAGNNPIAFGAPVFGDDPFIFDCSLSQVALGKVLLAAEKGEKIPLDWATDKDGNPTDDPVAASKGYLLAMGGHKGYGLSLAAEILSGVLPGGGFSHTVVSMYKEREKPSNISNLMLTINPLAVMDRERWNERMLTLKKNVKETPMTDPGQRAVFPGELEVMREKERRQNGIPLPESLFVSFATLGVPGAPLKAVSP